MAKQIDISEITAHAEVVGCDHQHVGKVDHVAGTDQLKLTKDDPDAHNMHHMIPMSWVESVEGNRVILNKTAAEAKKSWQTM